MKRLRRIQEHIPIDLKMIKIKRLKSVMRPIHLVLNKSIQFDKTAKYKISNEPLPQLEKINIQFNNRSRKDAFSIERGSKLQYK